MIDWDDVRFLLAVARGGSVRAAADQLGVNHATVLRRVARLESGLGAQVFERLPSGYRLTTAGHEILGLAEQMEASSKELETRVFARDQEVRGPLRVTLAPVLANHLLISDLLAFARRHPEVGMEILSIAEPLNLTNREADVALRVVYDRDALPLNLHGVKGPDIYGSVYVSRDLLAARRTGAQESVRWIVDAKFGIPDWVGEGAIPSADAPFTITDAEAQIAAARLGLGVTALPCFVGDADPQLSRWPGAVLHLHGTLWILIKRETRKTRRVRLFTDFIARRLAASGPLLAGRSTPEA